MKIAIIGHGRMGCLVEEIARSRGHEIGTVIDADNLADFETPAFRRCDVAIEFTTPATGVDNILRCFAAGVPVVSGTTGFADALPELRALCDEGKGTLIHSTNFSIGVNIFRAVNRYLATLMEAFPDYMPSMTEVHHVHKLDHPSGTAITLAEEIVACHSHVSGWHEPGGDTTAPEGSMPIAHERRGEVPGIHSITWDSPADSITLTHSAKNRSGFATGAVIAAEWLASHTGWHTIGEVLSDLTHTNDIFK